MRLFNVLLFIVLLACVPAQAAPLGSIAAVVNGEMITRYDLDTEAATEARRRGVDPQKPADAEKMDQLRRQVLDGMINSIILTQEARRMKVNVSDSDVDAELQRMIASRKLTPEEFKRQLQAQGTTEESVKKRIHDSLLRSRLLATMVGRKVVVTKEEIAQYYEQHHESFKSNQRVRFAVIVYPPTENAEKYAASIQSGATSFEKVARTVSVGPRPQEGGDVGSVEWTDLDPLWQDRLAVLTPGQASPLFDVNGLKTQLKLLALESGSGQSLEEATPQIEKILREPKLQERFVEYNEQLRKRAVIEIRL